MANEKGNERIHRWRHHELSRPSDRVAFSYAIIFSRRRDWKPRSNVYDNYSIFPSPRRAIDQNLNVSRKESIAWRTCNKASSLFSPVFFTFHIHLLHHFFFFPLQGENQFDAMPDRRDLGRRSPPIEGQSQGKRVLEKAAGGNSCCTFCSVVQGRKEGRGEMKERVWDGFLP